MKKTNTKKGFTIIELVIVIAVIGILAAVLIPTFSGVIEKANESAAMQAARNEYEVYLSEHAAELTGKENFVIVYKNTYAFEVKEGQFNATPVAKTAETIPAHGKVDLTKYVVKTAVAVAGSSEGSPATVAPAGDDTAVAWYSDATCKTVASSYTAGQTYYYSVALAKDIGNVEVAIYAA